MESLRRKDHALDPNVLPETVNTRRRWIETRAFTWQDSCSASFWQNGAESLEANTLRIYQSTIDASFYLFCMYMCTCVCRQRYGCIICRWVCRCLCVSFSLFVCIASEVDGRKLLFFQRLLPYSLDLRRSMCLMYVSEYMLLVRSSYLRDGRRKSSASRSDGSRLQSEQNAHCRVFLKASRKSRLKYA